MEEDGRIYVTIHDVGHAGKAVWLEELAHALQFIRDGNVPLSRDGKERLRREAEVAECLLQHSQRLDLPDSDIEHYGRICSEWSDDHE
jgi:hypothetical protein